MPLKSFSDVIFDVEKTSESRFHWIACKSTIHEASIPLRQVISIHANLWHWFRHRNLWFPSFELLRFVCNLSFNLQIFSFYVCVFCCTEHLIRIRGKVIYTSDNCSWSTTLLIFHRDPRLDLLASQKVFCNAFQRLLVSGKRFGVRCYGISSSVDHISSLPHLFKVRNHYLLQAVIEYCRMIAVTCVVHSVALRVIVTFHLSCS